MLTMNRLKQGAEEAANVAYEDTLGELLSDPEYTYEQATEEANAAANDAYISYIEGYE